MDRLSTISFIVSFLIYAILIAINFDPDVIKAQAEVAGESPFGIPVREFFIGLNALFFLPIFWWTPHFIKLIKFANDKENNRATSLFARLHTPLKLIRIFASVDQNAPQPY